MPTSSDNMPYQEPSSRMADVAQNTVPDKIDLSPFLSSVDKTKDVDPMVAQKSIALQRDTGINAGLDSNTVNTLGKQYETKISVDQVLAKDKDGNYLHPEAMRYLSDSANLAQLKPYISNYTELERNLDSANETWYQKAGRALQSGGYSMEANILKINNLLPSALQSKGIQEEIARDETLAQSTADIEQGKEALPEAIKGNLAPIAQQTLSGLPTLLAAASGGAVGAGTLFGLTGAGEEANKDKQASKSPLAAFVDEATNGVLNTTIGGGAIGQAVEKQGASTLLKALGNTGKGALKMGRDMTGLNLATQASDWATQNQPTTDGVKPQEIIKAAANDFFVNSTTGALIHGIGELGAYQSSRESARALAQAGQAMSEAINKQAPAMALKNMLEAKGEDDNAQVPAKEVVGFYQDAKKIGQFEKDNGLQPGEVQQAAADDKDINISKSQSAINHNDLFQALVDKQSIKFNGIDGDGAKALVAQAKDLAQQLQRRVDYLRQTIASKGKIAPSNLPPELENIRTTLLKDAKMSPEEANVQTAIIQSGLERLAAERGQDLKTWLKNNPLEVRKQKYDNFAQRVTAGTKNLFQEKRGALSYEGNKAIINLFEGSDRSTLLHETSHYLFEKMGEYAALDGASDQIKADHAILKEWSGGDKEKMAKGFEAYLMEGKAPRVDLRRPFARMAQWLNDIYRHAKSLLGNDKLTLEVRAVFDRRLASDEQIKQAQDFYALRDNLVSKLGTKPESEAKVEDARQKSEAELQSKNAEKLLAVYTRSQGGKSEIRKQIEKAYDESPIGSAVKKAQDNGGLDRELFEADYGKSLADKIAETHKGIFKKDGQLSLTDIASEGNADGFIADLSNSPSRKDAIDQMLKDWQSQTEQQLLQGESMRNGMSNADDTIVNSEATFKYLQAEAQALREELERTGKRQLAAIEAEAMKSIAEAEIDSREAKQAGNAKPYLNKARSIANEIKKIVGDKETLSDANKQKLYDLRREQIQNLYYAREANSASKLIDKLKQRYRPSAVVDRLERMAFGERGLYDAILKSFGERKDASIDPAFAQDVHSGSAGTLAAWLYDYSPELSANIPERFLTPNTQDGLMSLKLGDLKNVDASLQRVYGSGKDTLAEKAMGAKASAKEISASVVINLAKLSDYNINDLSNTPIGWLNQVRQRWGKAGAEMMMQLHRAMVMDADFSGKGKFAQLVLDGLEASSKASNLKTEKLTELGKSFQVMEKAKQRIEKELGKEFDIEGVKMDDCYKQFGDKNGKLTFERARAIILHTGTEDNYAKLKQGYGLTDDMVQRVAKLFTKEELETIQHDREALEGLWEPLREVYIRKYEESPEKLPAKAMTFTDKDGQPVTLKGGYAPIVYDRKLIAKVGGKGINEGQMNIDIDKDANNALFYKKSIGEGSLQGRQDTSGNYRPILLRYQQVFERHIDWASRYIHQQEFLDHASKVIMTPELKQAVSQKTGLEHYTALKNWVADMANPGRRAFKNEDSIRALENFSKSAALMMRPDNLVSWNLSMLNAVREIGNGDISKGFSAMRQIFPDMRGAEDFLKIGGKINDNEKKGIIETIKSLSPTQKARWEMAHQHLESNRLKLLSEDAKGSFPLKYMEHLGELSIEALDKGCSYYLWWGAYKIRLGELEKGGMSFEQQIHTASQWADGIVDKVQPIKNLATASEYMKTNEGYLHQLPLFKTFVSLAASRIHTNLLGATRGISDAKSYLTHLTLDVLAEPMAQVLWRALVYGGGASLATSLVMAPIAEVTNATGALGVPLGRVLEEMSGGSKSVVHGATGTNLKDTLVKSFTPGYLAKPINIAADNYSILSRYLSHKPIDQSRVVKDVADIAQLGAYMATGTNVPVGNITRSVQGTLKMAQGKPQ